MLLSRDILLLLSLASCSYPTSENRASSSVLQCMKTVENEDDYTATTRCSQLGPSRKFKGLWIYGFEVSSFRDTQPNTSTRAVERTRIIAPNNIISSIEDSFGAESKKFFVEFVGRESSARDSQFDRVIVMDRLISLSAE